MLTFLLGRLSGESSLGRPAMYIHLYNSLYINIYRLGERGTDFLNSHTKANNDVPVALASAIVLAMWLVGARQCPFGPQTVLSSRTQRRRIGQQRKDCIRCSAIAAIPAVGRIDESFSLHLTHSSGFVPPFPVRLIARSVRASVSALPILTSKTFAVIMQATSAQSSTQFNG